MMRKTSTSSEMSRSKSSSSGSSKGESIRLSSKDELTQVRPGIILIDGCEASAVGTKPGKTRAKDSGNLPQMADLSLNESKSEEKRQDVDFNDRFPDEILLHIFKYAWQPVHCWEAAKVCKRWCILQACNQLQKRSNHVAGCYPCIGLKKRDQSGRESHCDGSSRMLKLKKVESEWRLAMDFLKSCKRHTHALEIKDCTHVSVRGYQLISGFASNLKSIRLESCNSVDDPSFDAILDRCPRLRSIHLSMVPKLALRNIEKKAPKLQELHVYGCRIVTASTVISLLKGCSNLRSLSLSAMGVSEEWDESKIVEGSPLKLQSLKLSNTLAVTDRFLGALSQRLSNLRRLDLTHCPLLSDEGLKAVIASCGSGLQKLVVTRCPGISDDSVRALAGVAGNLQDLSLAGTNASDHGLRALLESDAVGSKLRNLSLARCNKVTDAGLQSIILRQYQLISLKVLDVQGCSEVSAFGLKALPTKLNGKPLKLVSEKKDVTISG